MPLVGIGACASSFCAFGRSWDLFWGRYTFIFASGWRLLLGFPISLARVGRVARAGAGQVAGGERTLLQAPVFANFACVRKAVF